MLIGLICKMPIHWVARPGVYLSKVVWQGFDCRQNKHSGCLVCCEFSSLLRRSIGVSIVDELWPIRTIQDSFWDEHFTWLRKVWNSWSTLSRETVSTGWFSFNNFLIPLIFYTDSLFTREAPVLTFPVGRMYFENTWFSWMADSWQSSAFFPV